MRGNSPARTSFFCGKRRGFPIPMFQSPFHDINILLLIRQQHSVFFNFLRKRAIPVFNILREERERLDVGVYLKSQFTQSGGSALFLQNYREKGCRIILQPDKKCGKCSEFLNCFKFHVYDKGISFKSCRGD